MDDKQMNVDKIPKDELDYTPATADPTSNSALPLDIAQSSRPVMAPAASGFPKVEDSMTVPGLEEPTEGTGKTEEQIAPLSARDTLTPSPPIPAAVLRPAILPMTVDGGPIAAEPGQHPGRPSPVDPQAYAPIDRPLNVTDALGYLDAVKVQFQDQPDVYNRFLDIMKEFKNEMIDTPGVIQRVSYLFNGHPSLIQGFNTFLPAGYQIECSTDTHDANFITVTTPTGTTIQTTTDIHDRREFSWSKSQVPSARVPEPHPSADAADGPLVLSPDPRALPIDGQAIEPAMQYVQKIKQRCDPETYRQFLDILSQYQSKPDSIDEEEVSRQIAMLFKDAPDLRSDFRIFMPERSQQNLDDPTYISSLDGRVRTGTPNGDGKGKRKLDNGDASGSGSNFPPKRKRRVVEKEREAIPVRPVPTASNKKLRQVGGLDLTPASYNNQNPPSPSRRMAQIPPSSRIPANDDTQFFDDVKRMLDNRETYNEFLKIVNLFTQDFIDTARLIKESRNFLGDGELMRQFKSILGWNERREREAFEADQHLQFGWTRPTIGGVRDRLNRADLHIKYGSYRRLSSTEINVTCSGRDEMCRSVLNDEWVSHPTWSSDDSGFVPHKKNIYEEALHRSEEERHEYDFHIEAIVRTTALLEPINNKIAQLIPEERGIFKLKPNMGGSWKSIHSRVVKKIYGRDAGLEMIQAMQETPSLAIPIALQRLKQKEEEWKRAQREWNKVWREVDARNYMKSLDHQAIHFKADDKKAITTKAFLNQIEGAREEQIARRASLIDPLFARTRPQHQLEFVVDDMLVLQDVLKLTFSFLDRTQAQINFAERKRIEGFLRSFVPLFFALDPVAFNSSFMVVQETVDSDMSDDLGSVDDVEASSSYGGSVRAGRNGRKGGNMSSGGDLRKKLLKSEQAKSTSRKTRAQEASPAVSRLASPAPVDEDPRADVQTLNRKSPRKNIFFTNTYFYVLLRLLEVLYSRLLLFKTSSSRLAAEGPPRRNPAVENLGLSLGMDERSATAEHYYELLLESLERLFDNEIEQHVFEDQMRYMFGTKDAYKAFTIDKVIGVIIKQVQTVLADEKSQGLLENLKRERSLASPTAQDQVSNSRNAEKILGPDENLFRICWLQELRLITFQLIGKDDSSFDNSEVLTGRWQAYIDSFVSNETTDGILPFKVKLPYLRRNLPLGVRDVQPNILTEGNLEIKICVRTYRIFYVSKTEDFLWRISSRDETKKVIEHLRARDRLRHKWLLNNVKK